MLHQLMRLNKLRGKLRINCLRYAKSKEEAIEAKLTDKEQLTELELSWHEHCHSYTRNAQPVVGADFERVEADVFEGLYPPENIKILSITDFRGSWYPSWLVGTQKSTKHLHKLVLESCIQLVSVPGPFFYSCQLSRALLLLLENLTIQHGGPGVAGASPQFDSIQYTAPHVVEETGRRP